MAINATPEQVREWLANGATFGPAVKLPTPEPLRAETPDRVSEKEFMWRIIAHAEANGWRYYHTYNSTMSNPGFPDLVLWKAGHNEYPEGPDDPCWHPGRVLFWEVKTGKGKTTKAQDETIASLIAAGQQARVVRPSDWEWIQKELAK